MQLAGLQALKDQFGRSQQALDLRKCGAKGTRTPGLLHAMQQEQRSGLGLDGFYLDLLCTGVPVSACQPVRVGCPLGCPLVSDHLLPAHRASVAQRSKPPPNDQPTAPDHDPSSCPPASAAPRSPVNSRSQALPLMPK